MLFTFQIIWRKKEVIIDVRGLTSRHLLLIYFALLPRDAFSFFSPSQQMFLRRMRTFYLTLNRTWLIHSVCFHRKSFKSYFFSFFGKLSWHYSWTWNNCAKVVGFRIDWLDCWNWLTGYLKLIYWIVVGSSIEYLSGSNLQPGVEMESKMKNYKEWIGWEQQKGIIVSTIFFSQSVFCWQTKQNKKFGFCGLKYYSVQFIISFLCFYFLLFFGFRSDKILARE